MSHDARFEHAVAPCLAVGVYVRQSWDQRCASAAASSARRRLQSLQALLSRQWTQLEAPPQSLQALLMRLCWQMLVPPQSLQLLLWRLCWQMLVPPQSLQPLLMRIPCDARLRQHHPPPRPRACKGHHRRVLVRLDLARQLSPLRFGIHFRVMTERLPEMPLLFLPLRGNASGLRAVRALRAGRSLLILARAAAAAAGESAAEASCPCPCEGMLS